VRSRGNLAVADMVHDLSGQQRVQGLSARGAAVLGHLASPVPALWLAKKPPEVHPRRTAPLIALSPDQTQCDAAFALRVRAKLHFYTAKCRLP
jgi:hypothetical protein